MGFPRLSILCAVILCNSSTLALTSLCPTIFQYKTTSQSATEFSSWSAVLQLQNHRTGTFVDVILDSPVTHFSAHHYDVMTSDWKKFHLSIRNQTHTTPTQSELNRIYMTVEFETLYVPRVEEIKLNGARICPSTQTTSSSSGTTARTTTSRRTPSTISTARDSRGFTEGQRGTTERYNPLASNNNNNRPVQDQDDNVYNPRETDRWPLNNNNNNNNGASGGDAPRTNPTTSSSSSSRQPSFVTNTPRNDDQWNINNNNNNRGTTTTTRRTTQVYPPVAEDRYRTTTSPYFPGDLHILFPPNGNDRRRSTENPLAVESCGVLSPTLNPLVVNGQAAHDGQFPWHAALYISQGVQLKYTCGGNLVSSRLILTAAHCVTLKRSATPMNQEHLLVYLGKSDLLHWQGQEQDCSVDEIVVHPDYNYSQFYSDMALLRLKKTIRYTDHVRPVCLWVSEDLKQVVGKVGRVPGWGYNEHGVVSTSLSYVEMPVVTHETCIWSNREVFSKITSDMSFCAGFRNGSNVCNGDSGGGMVFNQNGRWYLKGIVSVSVAIQNHFLCDPDHYVVFGDVSKYRQWIEGYF